MTQDRDYFFQSRNTFLLLSLIHISVFENQYALPFGYLYDKEWNQEEVKEMSGLDKTLASLSGFYYTDAEETSSYQKADLPEQTDLSLLDYADTATDCTMEKGSEGITVSNLGADPNVVFPGVASCFADVYKRQAWN